MIGPVLGYLDITYERYNSYRRSWEWRASFVGAGFRNRFDDRSLGIIGSAAYKFYLIGLFRKNFNPEKTLLQGLYLKPEIFLG